MLFDDLFDRFARRFRTSICEDLDEAFPSRNRRRTGPRNSHSGQHGSGFFNKSKNVVVNQPTFIENRSKIINNFVAGTELSPVLERIMKYANLDALVDSSARFPPSTCHPKTRLKIGDKMSTWFANPHRKSKLIWLHGPAGTGKSAVAQTFAERCAKIGRLGASFFFSRLNDRNDPNTVIPTLVYQLAVSHPYYKSLVTTQLVNDPGLFQKTRYTQFQKLIVEPLSQLQTQKRKRIKEPLLVVLDGLDECKDEKAQKEFVEMIGEVVQLKEDFPVVWLICSRPEPHLKYLLSRADFTVMCNREELAIDAESIADVDFYLRDGLAGIKSDFPDVTTPIWPPEEQVAELSRKACGHFGFAWTSLRYIGDPNYLNPMIRLDTLLSFLDGVSTGLSNPLEALDALYTAILDDVPEDPLQTTLRILGFNRTINLLGLNSVQGHCNFLHIDQATFYNAFRKLHSVVDIPSPESASQRPLRFYHASFRDYLLNPSRSGKFAIKLGDTYLDYAKSCLAWYKTDLELFHTTDGSLFNKEHKHGILPGLLWVSDGNIEEISCKIAKEAEEFTWFSLRYAQEWDEDLLSQIRNFDFRYIRTDNLYRWSEYLNILWEKDSSSGIVRTVPHTEVDLRLLECMKAMVGSLWSSRPAIFPLDVESSDRGDYLFVGHGSMAIICWREDKHSGVGFGMLNSDEPPSEERIRAYQALFNEDSNNSND